MVWNFGIWGWKVENQFYSICCQDPLQHPDELELVDAILRDGKELNKFLPVLFSLGVECILPRCSDTELADLEEVLKRPRDRREGQVISGYDRLFLALRNVCDRLSLKMPPLLRSETIDRTSLTYFNTDHEVSDYFGKVCFSFFNFSGQEYHWEAGQRNNFNGQVKQPTPQCGAFWKVQLQDQSIWFPLSSQRAQMPKVQLIHIWRSERPEGN